MKSFKTITAVVALVWLFGIFIFFQRPNLDEDLERLKQRFATKKHVAVRNELKHAKDSDVLKELMLRAARRDAFKKDILEQWRLEIEKDTTNEGNDGLENVEVSLGSKPTLREIPRKLQNRSVVGETERQALPADKAVAIAPDPKQQEASSNEESYNLNAPGKTVQPLFLNI